MAKPKCMVIIDGITQEGRKFRPSDWSERLAESIATVGLDHRIQYSPYVEPVLIDGHSALKVDPGLKESNQEAWDQLIAFARDNKLKVLETCEVPDFEAIEMPEKKV